MPHHVNYFLVYNVLYMGISRPSNKSNVFLERWQKYVFKKCLKKFYFL